MISSTTYENWYIRSSFVPLS